MAEASFSILARRASKSPPSARRFSHLRKKTLQATMDYTALGIRGTSFECRLLSHWKIFFACFWFSCIWMDFAINLQPPAYIPLPWAMPPAPSASQDHCRHPAPCWPVASALCTYIYLYIYIYNKSLFAAKKREKEIYKYRYIHIYIYISEY